MTTFAESYDSRYANNYRSSLNGYEIARWKALDHFVTRALKLSSAQTVLDYGSGSGLHLELWEKIFPNAELSFCDISPVAMEKFGAKHPRYAERYALVRDNVAGFPAGRFDVVVSIEVMEHVEHLIPYIKDIHRLLKPGGYYVWTTPCANACSVEHAFAFATSRIVPTPEGYRRWRWEDPGHLRRLKSREIRAILHGQGFSDVRFRFRAHLFSFLCTYILPKRFARLGNRFMTLDYSLFRYLPNGASMIGVARKAI